MSYDLSLMELLDSTELVRAYMRLRVRWGEGLVIELIRLMRSINELAKEVKRLRSEVDQLRLQDSASRPEE